MARIPFVTRNDVPENERAAYDAFLQNRGGQLNSGPYALLLHVPELAQRMESLRLYIRDQASVPQKLQELVMITVAREMDCGYIWYAHAAAVRSAGVRGRLGLAESGDRWEILVKQVNLINCDQNLRNPSITL